MESVTDSSKDERKVVFDRENVENDTLPPVHNDDSETSESEDDAVVPNFDENATFHQVRS